FLYVDLSPLVLHSFPTRRSSDLHQLVHAARMLECRVGLHVTVVPELVVPGGFVVAALLGVVAGVEPVGEGEVLADDEAQVGIAPDRKSTRLNSSHLVISYAVFCL